VHQQLLAKTAIQEGISEGGGYLIRESDLGIKGGMTGQKSRQLRGKLQGLDNRMHVLSIIVGKLGHAVDLATHQYFVSTVIKLSARRLEVECIEAKMMHSRALLFQKFLVNRSSGHWLNQLN